MSITAGPFNDQRNPDEWYKGCPLYVCQDSGNTDAYIMLMWEGQLRIVEVEDGILATCENALKAARLFVDDNEEVS